MVDLWRLDRDVGSQTRETHILSLGSEVSAAWSWCVLEAVLRRKAHSLGLALNDPFPNMFHRQGPQICPELAVNPPAAKILIY